MLNVVISFGIGQIMFLDIGDWSVETSIINSS